jgi:hypothetical protein
LGDLTGQDTLFDRRGTIVTGLGAADFALHEASSVAASSHEVIDALRFA